LVLMFGAWAFSVQSANVAVAPTPDNLSNTAAIGVLLYTRYVYAFQASGMVLLVAMIGAIVLTHRAREGVRHQKIGQQVGRSRAKTVELVKVRPGQGV
jgi:NADH-quinone oxidoreductase subunit J